MKLIYLSHWRFPSEKTMTPLILKTCEGFVSQGFEVELWIPARHNPDDRGGDLLGQYGIAGRFEVRRLPAIDIIRFAGVFGFLLMAASFNISSYVRLRRYRGQYVALYAHDLRDLILPALRGFPAFVEIHDFYESSISFVNRMVFKRITGFVVTNTIKMELLARRYHISRDRMLHQQNAVDVKKFDTGLSRSEARARLGLPAERIIALYTGHLFSWKGVDALADAAEFLPENVWVYFVGGTPEDRAKLRNRVEEKRLTRIEFIPHQPHEKIPLFQKAADVLVLPNTAKEEASRVETSPVKLFEYLASGTPIVASDIPSIRDIVSEREVAFAKPDDPASFAEAIEKTLRDPEAAARSRAGLAFAQEHSWEARAEDISRFIRSLTDHAA